MYNNKTSNINSIHNNFFSTLINAFVVIPVLWADDDGVFTDPALLHREKPYRSVGLEGSSFISPSDPALPPPEILADNKKQKYYQFYFESYRSLHNKSTSNYII